MQQPNLDSRNSDHHNHHNAVLGIDATASEHFTPAPCTDSEGRGSLWDSASGVRGGLFSPINLDLSANGSGSSLQLGSSSIITPKRKLSMDMDESTQDASDSGYSRSVSCSSHESCTNFSGALERVIKRESTSTCGTRSPLCDLTNAVACQRKKFGHAQKAKRSISFPNEGEKSKKVLSSENQEPVSAHTCVSSTSSLPPLPYSPLTHESLRSQKNVLQQINSPLERMTLVSPGVPSTGCGNPPTFTFPSHPARANSVESDGYSEVFDGEESSSNTNSLPSGLTGLLNAPFTSVDTSSSAGNEAPVHSTPVVWPGPSSRVRFSLARADSWSQAKSIARRGSLKRASPCPESTQQPKRMKPPLPTFESKSLDTPNKSSPLKGVQLSRSQSCFLGVSENNLYPLSPGSDNGEMIGDHTKAYVLPLSKKRSVPDLKCISPHTLAELIEDGCSGAVDEYTILDCRYPYEYEGGHIRGAQNVWDKDSLHEQFFTNPQYLPESRRIIVFHCEFSSKRGPDMSRFMRKIDRQKNDMAFPRLYYPELYLLEGGYKAFYEKFPNLCEPSGYVQMLDDNHKEELRHFKHRSKSWTGGDAAACKRRGSHLRPRRSTVDSSHRRTGAPLPSKN